MSKKWKAVAVALAAIASLYLVRATGLDQGMIDRALGALVEALSDSSDAPAEAPAGQ